MPGELRVEPLGGDQWRLWRDLRLEALQDTPIGYGESYADALASPEQRWVDTPARPGSHHLAWDGTRPVGMAGGFVDDQGRPVAFGVYVRPEARGSGAVGLLLDAVGEWARGLGADQLRLEVHEDNARAAAAYLRLGWVFTGERRAYDLDPSRQLLAMTRSCPRR